MEERNLSNLRETLVTQEKTLVTKGRDLDDQWEELSMWRGVKDQNDWLIQGCAKPPASSPQILRPSS